MCKKDFRLCISIRKFGLLQPFFFSSISQDVGLNCFFAVDNDSNIVGTRDLGV